VAVCEVNSRTLPLAGKAAASLPRTRASAPPPAQPASAHSSGDPPRGRRPRATDPGAIPFSRLPVITPAAQRLTRRPSRPAPNAYPNGPRPWPPVKTPTVTPTAPEARSCLLHVRETCTDMTDSATQRHTAR
jgi:hypothetical protein